MGGGKSTGKRKYVRTSINVIIFLVLNFRMHRMKGSVSDDEHPLPIQTYATLKDRQLKEMLQEYDLLVSGDRSNWEQRHQRYAFSPFWKLVISNLL